MSLAVWILLVDVQEELMESSKVKKVQCVTSGFHHDVNEICAILELHVGTELPLVPHVKSQKFAYLQYV